MEGWLQGGFDGGKHDLRVEPCKGCGKHTANLAMAASPRPNPERPDPANFQTRRRVPNLPLRPSLHPRPRFSPSEEHPNKLRNLSGVWVLPAFTINFQFRQILGAKTENVERYEQHLCLLFPRDSTLRDARNV